MLEFLSYEDLQALLPFERSALKRWSGYRLIDLAFKHLTMRKSVVLLSSHQLGLIYQGVFHFYNFELQQFRYYPSFPTNLVSIAYQGDDVVLVDGKGSIWLWNKQGDPVLKTFKGSKVLHAEITGSELILYMTDEVQKHQIMKYSSWSRAPLLPRDALTTSYYRYDIFKFKLAHIDRAYKLYVDQKQLGSDVYTECVLNLKGVLARRKNDGSFVVFSEKGQELTSFPPQNRSVMQPLNRTKQPTLNEVVARQLCD